MRAYNANDPQDELLLLNWWSTLVETQELHTVFDERYERISEFLIAFRQDVLLVEVDEKGIWGAFWYDRSPLAGAFFSLWLRKDHRQSRASLTAIAQAIGVGFHELNFRAILVVTKEKGIAEMHRRYGFTRLGVVPGLYFGDAAIVSYMTDDMYDQVGRDEAPADEPPIQTLNGASRGG